MIERDGVASYYTRRVRKVDDRVSRIWTCVAAGLGSPFVRDYLDQLRKWDGASLRDYEHLLQLGHYTTSAMILYTPDPPDLDVFKSIEVVRREAQKLGRGRGDCGTYTAVKATMYGAWGMRVGCRVIAQARRGFDHVFNIAQTPDGRIVRSDASTTPVRPWNWEPPPGSFNAVQDFWLDNLREWIDWFYAGADESRMPSIISS